MTDLTTELEDQLTLVKKCILNGEADEYPDRELIAANKARERDLRIALRALYAARTV